MSSEPSLVDSYTADSVQATLMALLDQSPTFVGMYNARRQSCDFRLSDFTFTNHFVRYTLDGQLTCHVDYDPDDQQLAEERSNLLARSFSTHRHGRLHFFLNIGAAPGVRTEAYRNWQAHLIGEILCALRAGMLDDIQRPTSQLIHTLSTIKGEMGLTVYVSDLKTNHQAKRHVRTRYANMRKIGLMHARDRQALSSSEFRSRLARVAADLSPYYRFPKSAPMGTHPTAERLLPNDAAIAQKPSMPVASLNVTLTSSASKSPTNSALESSAVQPASNLESGALADEVIDILQRASTPDDQRVAQEWLQALPEDWTPFKPSN